MYFGLLLQTSAAGDEPDASAAKEGVFLINMTFHGMFLRAAIRPPVALHYGWPL